MRYWDSPARWINTILLSIVGFIGLDTLFRLLRANGSNIIVRFVNSIAGLFLAPFEGMFAGQEYLLTAMIAILGYCLLAGIALAVVRSVQASRPAQSAPRRERVRDRGRDVERPYERPRERPRERPSNDPDRTQRL